MKNSTKKFLRVGLGVTTFPAWKEYKRIFEENGLEVKELFLYGPDWITQLHKQDKDVDFYFFHSDTMWHEYRQILDRIYYIENILKKKVYPDMNQYFSFNDKIKQNDLFNLYSLPHIETFITKEKEEAKEYAEKTKYPIIVKNAHGAGGEDVEKIENKEDAFDLIEKIFSDTGYVKSGFQIIKDYFYVQPFIKHEKDLRIITIGDRVETAYWRISDDWRKNISRGADFSFEDIPENAKKMCLEISKKLGFNWMAYDILMIDNEPKLLEWTCNFEAKAPLKMGINMTERIVKWVLNDIKKYE